MGCWRIMCIHIKNISRIQRQEGFGWWSPIRLKFLPENNPANWRGLCWQKEGSTINIAEGSSDYHSNIKIEEPKRGVIRFSEE